MAAPNPSHSEKPAGNKSETTFTVVEATSGICAGSYLACEGFSWGLNVLDAKTVSNKWRRGRAIVKIELTQPGHNLLGKLKHPADIKYVNGPILAPANSADIPDFSTAGFLPLGNRRERQPQGGHDQFPGSRLRQLWQGTRGLLWTASRTNAPAWKPCFGDPCCGPPTARWKHPCPHHSSRQSPRQQKKLPLPSKQPGQRDCCSPCRATWEPACSTVAEAELAGSNSGLV